MTSALPIRKRILLALGRFVENLHQRSMKNYLLKCPHCKKPTLVYFRVVTTKLGLWKRLRSLFRHEYLCTNCNTFTHARDVITLELQKGDPSYVDEGAIRRKKELERAGKLMEDETKKGVHTFLGLDSFRRKRSAPRLRVIVKKKEHVKKDHSLTRLERDIERYDERDFLD